MASKTNLITTAQLDKLLAKSRNKRRAGMHADGGGLYLRIRDSGNAAWTFRYRYGGKDRWMDVGSADDMPLATARTHARKLRVAVDEGRDPIAERRAADAKVRERGSFKELAEDWYKSEIETRYKHPLAVRRALDNYLLPPLGTSVASEVKPSDCARVLDNVRDEFPTAANDLLRYLKAIYNFAIRRRRYEGSPVAAFSARLDAGGKEGSRTRALSRDELMALFAAIRDESTFGADNLLMIRLLLALCVRKGELIGARWDEFELDTKASHGPVWRLPAERSKTEAALDIPLAPQVVEWLTAAKLLAGSSEFVFPARRRDPRARAAHVGIDTLNVALTRLHLSKVEAFTIHDLRRTARTHLSALGVAPHVAELCLNHKPKGVAGIYNRHSYFDERRAALTAWAALLVELERGSTKVVGIKSAEDARKRARG